ncbi:MAG: hypothetical protein JW783_00040 [Bacteroidales bacterium]|nr:hypothetical protein [Bacteroidales bacterium]MBN2748719.1 hypothetical protein [Bacteroidales bacterium]
MLHCFRRIAIATSLLLIASTSFAQRVVFNNSSDYLKVARGAVVTIATDSAFVVSKSRAHYLNERLDELSHVKTLYNNLSQEHSALLDGIKGVEVLLGKLISDEKAATEALDADFEALLNSLDTTLTSLKRNNTELQSNNKQLETTVTNLKSIEKELKRKARWIWWNGLTDKIIVFAGGVGVGVLIALL